MRSSMPSFAAFLTLCGCVRRCVARRSVPGARNALRAASRPPPPSRLFVSLFILQVRAAYPHLLIPMLPERKAIGRCE